MRRSKRFAAEIVLLAMLVGCADTAQVTRDKLPTTARPSSPVSPTSTPVLCPVTIPNRSTPPQVTDWSKEGGHGNGMLWTELWRGNVVLSDPRFVEPDGSIGMKWPWW